MTMNISTAAIPAAGTGISRTRAGLGESVRCLVCSLLHGRVLSLDHYRLRSTWELEALNDGTLRDIGIHRSAIEAHTIARK